MQSAPHEASSSSQCVPACGISIGHPCGRAWHAHSGGEIGEQKGYAEPPSHSLQLQTVPSGYQQKRFSSEHCVPIVAGELGHCGGKGGVLQKLASAGGVMSQVPSSWQMPLVRHKGRGSLPQVHCPVTLANSGAPNVQPLPFVGGVLGQVRDVLPPSVPDVPPAVSPPHAAAAVIAIKATNPPRTR